MTLLVVLGVVVVVTILAALFLSLRSGRNRDGASAAGAVGNRQGRGGSRSERSPSLADRARSMAGRGKDDEYPGRRVAGRRHDGFDDDFGSSRRDPRGPGAGQDRSGLVASGTGRRQGRGRPEGGFDDTDPAFRAGYGRDAGDYDGYDASPSGPLPTEAGTEVFGSGGYGTQEPSGRSRPGPGRGAAPGSYPEPGRDDYGQPEPGFGRPEPVPGRGAPPAAAAYDFGAEPGAPTADFSGPGQEAGPDRDADEDTGRGGRRRVTGRIQRPRLRRDKSDFDNDPWPSYDEDDSAVPDEKYWSDIYSDRPLSTTARPAHAAADADQGWGEPAADAAPPQADPDAHQGRGRRRRRQDDALEAGTEPRPAAPPGPGPSAGGGRHGVPRPSRPAEDPLTSESFSRHAREATDSRSYRGSRAAGDPNRPPSRGRPDPSGADTQSMRPDPRGYGPDPLSGPSPLSPRPPASGRGAPGSGGGAPSGGPPAVPGGPGSGYPSGPGGGYPGGPRRPRQRLSGRPGQRPATGRTP